MAATIETVTASCKAAVRSRKAASKGAPSGHFRRGFRGYTRGQPKERRPGPSGKVSIKADAGQHIVDTLRDMGERIEGGSVRGEGAMDGDAGGAIRGAGDHNQAI